MPPTGLRVFALVLLLAPRLASTQIVRDSPPAPQSAATADAPLDMQSLIQAQLDFENFRFDHLPSPGGTVDCDKHIGGASFCHNERSVPPPDDPPVIRQERDRLIALLNSFATNTPGDRWAAEQRVRYLVEAGRADSALAAARECHVHGWACDALTGFSLHALGRYAAADSAYGRALTQMSAKERCDWRDLNVLVDDDTRGLYNRLACGDPRREAAEDRIWFFARPLYSLEGNDARTEYYSRKTMEMMLRDAPDIAIWPNEHIELMLRFGIVRAWGKPAINIRPLVGVLSGRGVPVGGQSPAPASGIHSHPPFANYQQEPAFSFIPPGVALANPSLSDSLSWRPEPPSPISQYAPAYMTSLMPLEHQEAMFRRGDTALVVMAYDARAAKQLAGTNLTAALVIAPTEKPADYGKIVHDAQQTGALIARAPWGPLLMSAEVYAPERKTVARARYGISPPFSVGPRVTLSDLLFYKPYGSFPSSVEEAAPHALPTERVMSNEKLGVYWEAYGTDPAGEKLKVSLTVVKEGQEGGILKRLTQALKNDRAATPVVVTVEDLSASGASMTPRALDVDISTLKKGSYIVQLEIEVGGQFAVRAEHRIEVIGP